MHKAFFKHNTFVFKIRTTAILVLDNRKYSVFKIPYSVLEYLILFQNKKRLAPLLDRMGNLNLQTKIGKKNII